jgi:hypothetical protein
LKMKKVILIVFLIFLCGGCAARKAKIFLPQVTSPAAERAGLAFQGTPFQILNGAPFFCQLVAGGKNLGLVGPGDLVFDQRHLHNLWAQYIPVAAVCYRDATLTDYVGAAGRIMTLGQNIPAEWVIRSSDIQTPDGRPVPTPIPSAASPTSRRIKLLRESLSVVGIQIINNAAADVKIFINGKPIAVLGTGGVYHTSAEIVGNYSRPLIITITMGTGCVHTEQVWVNKNIQWARQIIFDAGLCSGWWGWR